MQMVMVMCVSRNKPSSLLIMAVSMLSFKVVSLLPFIVSHLSFVSFFILGEPLWDIRSSSTIRLTSDRLLTPLIRPRVPYPIPSNSLVRTRVDSVVAIPTIGHSLIGLSSSLKSLIGVGKLPFSPVPDPFGSRVVVERVGGNGLLSVRGVGRGVLMLPEISERHRGEVNYV